MYLLVWDLKGYMRRQAEKVDSVEAALVRWKHSKITAAWSSWVELHEKCQYDQQRLLSCIHIFQSKLQYKAFSTWYQVRSPTLASVSFLCTYAFIICLGNSSRFEAVLWVNLSATASLQENLHPLTHPLFTSLLRAGLSRS